MNRKQNPHNLFDLLNAAYGENLADLLFQVYGLAPVPVRAEENKTHNWNVAA
jgi:hypothetical protein